MTNLTNSIRKFAVAFQSIGWRLAVISFAFFLLIFFLSQITWNLARWGQKQDLDRLSSVPNTNNRPSSSLLSSVNSKFKPLTKAEFEQMQGGIHTVGEWKQTRQFSQAPMLDQLPLPPVADRLPLDPLVIYPPDQNGPYGGRWQRYGTSAPDVGIFRARLAYDGLVRWGPMAQQILPNLVAKMMFLIQNEKLSNIFSNLLAGKSSIMS